MGIQSAAATRHPASAGARLWRVRAVVAPPEVAFGLESPRPSPTPQAGKHSK
ncbi:MAG: hypothetical protein ACXVCR_12355 [Bdellovibrio sp.]